MSRDPDEWSSRWILTREHMGPAADQPGRLNGNHIWWVIVGRGSVEFDVSEQWFPLVERGPDSMHVEALDRRKDCKTEAYQYDLCFARCGR